MVRNRKYKESIHEAGHAVVAIALDVKFVGLSVLTPEKGMTVGVESGPDLITDLAIIYAGDQASGLFLNERTFDYPDSLKAIAIMSKNEEYVKEMSYVQIGNETTSIARKILQANPRAVKRIARELAKRQYLPYSECIRVAGHLIAPATIIDKHNS